MQVDRDNIATFVEVFRRESLAAAGRHMGIPKSTVSRRLSRLEERLGAKLLHRDARRVTPTAEGMRFYDSVVDAIDALDTAVTALEQRTTEPRGTIRLTAPSDLGRMVVIPLLGRFLARYPDIALDLVITNRFVDLVQEQVDLAVRAGAVTGPDLIARRWMRSDFQLAASAGFAVECEHITGLEDYPFVLYRKRGQTQVIRLERMSDPLDTVELTVSGRVNVDDYGAMLELVARGQGIGLMPEQHVAEGEKTGRLVRIFPEWVLPWEPVHLVYSTRQLPERVRLLIDFLESAPVDEPPRKR
jgi:DNA-binding transcriptional LysR family regulator